jgi:hypothetical protein
MPLLATASVKGQVLYRWLVGHVNDPSDRSIPSNPSPALVYNVIGASHNSSNFSIDGASSTNVWLPHASAYVVAGGAATGVHGSAFEYQWNNKMKAQRGRLGDFFGRAGRRYGNRGHERHREGGRRRAAIPPRFAD